MSERLTDEELASIEHGSTWIEGVGGPNAILHRLVAEIRSLRAENAELRKQADSPWRPGLGPAPPDRQVRKSDAPPHASDCRCPDCGYGL